MGNTHHGTLKRKNDYNEYTIMLVGRMGAGKSSLGNFLLKKNDFKVSDSMGRVTERNMSRCIHLPGGIKLKIIDTPGFGDFRDINEVKKDLSEAFYEAKDGVDAFIFVISAAERIGKELVGQFEMFKKFMHHDHFYDYVIPVFTKVDTKLRNKGVAEVHSYEKQERIIDEELKNVQLKEFHEKILKQANENWMCISSNNSKDDFYYKHITDKLISTIEKIRRKRRGMVCTGRIMEKAKEKSIEEKEKEEMEIRRLVVGLILHLLLSEGEQLDEIYGGDSEAKEVNNTNQLGATGTASDLRPK